MLKEIKKIKNKGQLWKQHFQNSFKVKKPLQNIHELHVLCVRRSKNISHLAKRTFYVKWKPNLTDAYLCKTWIPENDPP